VKLAFLGVAGAVAALVPPSFQAPGYPLDLSGSGSRVAVVTSECAVRVGSFGRPAATVRPPAPCRDPEASVATDGVWLGRNAIVVQTIDSPSPHGDTYGIWTGPLPRGPLHRVGSEWGWTDSDVPGGYGCAWSVASGGGVIAMAKTPNALAVVHGNDTKPVCPAGPTTTIRLIGTSPSSFAVPGSWSVLATDGKRVALERLDANADPTGELGLFAPSGKRLSTPRVAAATIKASFRAWLTPDGIVVATRSGVVTPRWSVREGGDVTVGYGRVLYLKGRTLHVRRIRGGPDRPLATLPSSEALIAAGSFGVAIATGSDTTSVYRIPWRTIDRVLPR
jgi:hypothetical protein